ncbi:protein of unknown function [Taphrina deformans PYCC 5710]|uniref:Wax synthase domain-containing protein n=1 Tax=Taphrina deformans (strain PYCC 5710 / ATCC 11124 / CBS 356.35 / IMI 108563 / JCM 9778 / NBRC 8474) TaxID=1097556 RepID=R4XDA1_TAPDE|nr:protein of unknown function [Taphrina deformans PYCC 5710]|eukprot:CCG82383.1 protein of unknown function [Taphrina deformans PYCC 5710]
MNSLNDRTATTVLGDHTFDGRVFVFSSWLNIWDFSLPHLYLIVAFYSVATRKRTLGCIASLLGVKAYLETTQSYHLYWKGATALMCFAYAYGAIKVAELGIVMLKHKEDQYDPQVGRGTRGTATVDRIKWSLAATANLRCIGFKCGKREYPIPRPTRSEILFPAFRKLGVVDVLTTVMHHLALHNGGSTLTSRPSWQQISIVFLIGISLFNLFQGLYGVLQYFGLYWLDMSPSQWPPMLLKPWTATSLSQFWSKEWHSVFRRIFLFYTDLIVEPMTSHYRLSSRSQAALRTVTVFFMSALLHDLGLYLFWRQHSLRTYVFFLSQGLGVLLEQFVGISKYPVLGFIWTYSFLFFSAGPFGMIGDVVDHGMPNTILTDGFFHDISITSRLINFCFNTNL